MFFLKVSKDEQKRRFLEGLDQPDKNRKFSPADLADRMLWGHSMRAYPDCLSATSTRWASRYVVPPDHKRLARAVVADVISTTIRSLDLKYPRWRPGSARALLKRSGDCWPSDTEGAVRDCVITRDNRPNRGGEHETGELYA